MSHVSSKYLASIKSPGTAQADRTSGQRQAKIVSETTPLVEGVRDESGLEMRFEEPEEPGGRMKGKTGVCGGRTLIAVSLVLLLLAALGLLTLRGHSARIVRLHDGSRIYISSAKYGLYLRADTGDGVGAGASVGARARASARENVGAKVAITESIPWQHGSSLEVVTDPSADPGSTWGHCFALRTMTGTYLRVHEGRAYFGKGVEADADLVAEADAGVGAGADAGVGAGLERGASGAGWMARGVGGAVLLEAVTQPGVLLSASKNTHSRVSQDPADLGNVEEQGEGKGGKGEVGKGGRGGEVIGLVELRICGEPARLVVQEEKEEVREDSPSSTLVLVSAHLNRTRLRSVATSSSQPSAFRIHPITPIRGVNLGGWFIPEKWMNPSFSNYTSLKDASLCNVVKFNHSLAQQAMAAHLEAWLSEQDFAQMAAAGFNSVRLPVGYWNLLDPEPSTAPRSEPSNTPTSDVDAEADAGTDAGAATPDSHSVHGPFAPSASISLPYIDWAFDMAHRHGLSVLLDLHGLPGSQNGLESSGCSGSDSGSGSGNGSGSDSGSGGVHWLDTTLSVDLTLQAVQVMAERYGQHPALTGFELANAPALSYCTSQFPKLLDVYHRAYKAVRLRCKMCSVVFNEINPACYELWGSHLREPRYYNVLMDIHLYDFTELQPESESAALAHDLFAHAAIALAWEVLISNLMQMHPVLVGEWSFAGGAGQPFVNACVNAFKSSWGWYVWTWKVDKLGVGGFDEWDVKLQYEMPDGLRVEL